MSVTVNDVRKILPAETTLTDPQIEVSIEAAVATTADLGIATTKLDLVNRYLSAHFAAATENTLTVKSEKDDCADSSVTYGFVFGKGIMGTPFGQMANTLSDGLLQELDKPKPQLFSIGSINR